MNDGRGSSSSFLAAGAGAVVARGKIKVDAQKALHKLRDHMLVDHHLWACEIGRMAVALGAPLLEIAYDADDVILSFGGRLLPIEAIARARDHVLTPPAEGDVDGDAMRVLGIGVSAALALDPSFVDVYRADGAECVKVRFERHHLDVDATADDSAALDDDAAPTPERVTRPSDLKNATWMTRVHVRKRLGLDILGRALRGGAPREVLLLLDAARDAPIEVRVHKAAGIKREKPPPAVLRIDLDEPGVTRGALEVLSPKTYTRADSCLLFLERGVRLARYTLNVGFAASEEGALPIRVVIDAERLPTNASRSELRMDTDLVRRLLARIEPAFVSALDTLEAVGLRGEVVSPVEIGHAPEVLVANRSELVDALGAITADVAISLRANSQLPIPDRVKTLLSLPLLVDALGKPMAFVDLKGGGLGGAAPLYVYQGHAPAPNELAPWLAGTVWRRGVAAERGFANWLLAPADDLVARAYDAYARRARALEHAPSPPTLSASPAHLLRERFAVKEGPFSGLEGEIALMRRGEFSRSSTARLFVDERLLETSQLPGVGLAVEIALAWPGKIVARFEYDAVERNEWLSKAVLYALRLAAVCAGERLQPADPELIRLAIAAWCGSTTTLRDAEINGAALGRLAYAEAWMTTEGKNVSLLKLEDYVRQTRALCVASKAIPLNTRAPDGRPVVYDSQLDILKPFLLPQGTPVVPYDRALMQPPNASAEKLAADAGGLPAVAIHQGNVQGFLAVSTTAAIGRRRTYHAGFLLKDETYASRGAPVLLAIDDRGAVPSLKFDSLLWSSIVVGLGREEDALTEIVIERCERGEIDFESVREWVSSAENKLRGKSDAVADRLAALPEKVARMQRLARKAAVTAQATVTAETILLTSPAIPLAARGRIGSPVGDVTVALAREHLRAELQFEGHPIGSTVITSLPIVSVVSIKREDHIADDWRGFNEKGQRWAHSGVIEASMLLLAELLKSEDFVQTSAALDLLLGLQQMAPQRVGRAAMAAAWPTVQGGKMWLPEDPTSISIGSTAYSPYRTCAENEEPSSFDGPAIHVRKDWLGELWTRVLKQLGHTLVDVTEPIARIQSRRARGLPTAPPRLGGEPKKPFLRTSLASLGQTIVEGELELVEGDRSEVARAHEDGTTTPVEWPPGGVAVHLVFRAESQYGDQKIHDELVYAIGRFVGRLVPQMEEEPFLKARLRYLLCQLLRVGTRPEELEPLNVFPMIDQRWTSLREIIAKGQIHVTFDGPPWHVIERVAPILFLTTDESFSLSKVVSVLDVTEGLRIEKQGVLRRATAPLAAIELTPEVRAQCICTFLISQEGIRGEIGLLLPAYGSERKVDLFTTMRPLCRIPDPDGWPIVAAINDDAIIASPGFDRIANDDDTKSVARIHLALKIAIGRQMASVLEAPRDTAGVIRLPAPYLLTKATSEGQRPVSAIGVFWLPRVWPEIPEVRVEMIGAVDPFRSPLIENLEATKESKKAHHGLLPVCGRVYISAASGSWSVDRALEEVFQWVRARLAAIIRESRRSSSASKKDEQLEAYEWDLALLGVFDQKNPVADLAVDRPNEVLVRVATRRAPHLMIKTEEEEKRGGGINAPLRGALPPLRPQTPPLTGESAEINVYATTTEAAVDEAELAGDRPSFLGGLVTRVVGLFGGEDAITTTDSPLARSLGVALTAMKLTGDPVASVVETTSGRPVRYDRAKKRILINTSHASIKALLQKPTCVLVLLASAVSEVNRDLVPVTDAEELAILLDLLRANE